MPWCFPGGETEPQSRWGSVGGIPWASSTGKWPKPHSCHSLVHPVLSQGLSFRARGMNTPHLLAQGGLPKSFSSHPNQGCAWIIAQAKAPRREGQTRASGPGRSLQPIGVSPHPLNKPSKAGQALAASSSILRTDRPVERPGSPGQAWLLPVGSEDPGNQRLESRGLTPSPQSTSGGTSSAPPH